MLVAQSCIISLVPSSLMQTQESITIPYLLGAYIAVQTDNHMILLECNFMCMCVAHAHGTVQNGGFFYLTHSKLPFQLDALVPPF